MNVANTTTQLEMAAGELQQAVSCDESTFISTPQQILRSALDALSEGKLSEVVKHFDEDGCFRFSDHALTLEFTDKPRLTEFLKNLASSFQTLHSRSFLFLGTGTTPLLNGSWRRHRTSLPARSAIDFRSPCLAQRSCMSRKEKLSNGRTTTTKAHRGG